MNHYVNIFSNMVDHLKQIPVDDDEGKTRSMVPAWDPWCWHGETKGGIHGVDVGGGLEPPPPHNPYTPW